MSDETRQKVYNEAKRQRQLGHAILALKVGVIGMLVCSLALLILSLIRVA